MSQLFIFLASLCPTHTASYVKMTKIQNSKTRIQKPQKNVMTLVRPLAASVANSKFSTHQVHPCLQGHHFLFFSRPFAPPAGPLSLRGPKFKIQKPQKNAMTLVRPLAASVANSKFSTHQVHPCLHGHHFLFWSRPFGPPAGPLSLRRQKFKIQKPQKNAMTLVRPLATSVANSKFSTHQVHPCLQGHHFLFFSRPFAPLARPLSLKRPKFKIQKPQRTR
jgi:DNA-binding ferritin-like protein